MKLFKTHRKLAVSSLALVVAIMAGGAAYAYLTAGGTGAGSATVGSVADLSITQVGAGYDSLITSNAYVQDQCLSCAGPMTEFGNDIDLAAGSGQLSDVVVALRNWGDAIPGASLTFNIYDPSNLTTPIATDTQSFNIPVATVDVADAWSPTSVPSVYNAIFDFSSQDITLPTNVVYGISYAAVGNLNNLNIALSSSATDLSAGQDQYPGNVWVLSGVADPISTSGDANSCGNAVSVPGSFSAEYIWCGFNSNNPGAYGTTNGEGADIPAVEFNVVGGAIPTLFPNDPPQNIGYAITNTGAAQQVNSVSVAVAFDPATNFVESTAGNTATDVAGCYVQWFQINNTPEAVNYQVPQNSTTIFGTAMQATVGVGSELSIQMLNGTPGNPQNQDDCEGHTLALVFTSN
jgi:hypothetical protein